METLLFITVLIGVPTLLAAVFIVANYNRMARLQQHIRESWSGIDVELKRRYELIPNLVATVRGYAKHERDTLEQIVALRNRAMENHGEAALQAVDESALMIAMKRLFALVEAYPELKADTHFLALQRELSITEDRIAAARRFYNANIREMNQLCRMFPTNIVACTFGFRSGSFFELDRDAEYVVPRVEL